MGVLWDKYKTKVLAYFEDGNVYSGHGLSREWLGTYTSDEVCDRFGNTVAKFNGNTAYSPLLFSTEAYCTSNYGTIYKGGSKWNDMLAVYDDDSYGACAAAVLYFELYKQEKTRKQGEKRTREPIPLQNGTNNRKCGVNSYGESIIGAIIVFLVGAIATYAFWFTRWGLNMIFGEKSGRQVLFICLACAVISSIIIYRSNSINGFFEISGCVLGLNITITYIIVLIIAFVEDANRGRLSFGEGLILIIGGAFGTVGVASLICIIEILVLYFAKKYKNKNK